MALCRGQAELPAGCEVTYELEVQEVLKRLLQPTTIEDQLRETYREFLLQHGRRPTAREMFMSGGMQRETLRRGFGSWFGLVGQMGDLGYDERDLMQRHGAFLSEVEQSRMERSYRMLVLEAMLEEGRLPGSIPTATLAARFQRIVDRSPMLRQELAATMAVTGGSLEGMLHSNPLRAWAGTKRGVGSEFFELNGDRFATKFGVRAGATEVAEGRQGDVLAAMVRELVEWRLAEYLVRSGHGSLEAAQAPPEAPASGLLIGRSYMRDEIPPLFGLSFTRSVWQQGIVSVPNGLVLLVTLDKEGKEAAHKYEDRFLSREVFQWQSQNQTSRDGKHGTLIQNHVKMGKQIHLFVRKRGKRANSTATPFLYCGELAFDRWEGERPITVWWHLNSALSDSLAEVLLPRD